MQLRKGQKLKLQDLTGANQITIDVRIQTACGEADVTCFGVDGSEKLCDDRYFIFYNQTSAPDGSISMQKQEASTTFSICLDRLPAAIEKLVITAAADGGKMRDVTQGSIAVCGAEYPFTGESFTGERAVILAEVYRKAGVWRLAIVSSGFDGGLSALLAHFGGEEESTPAPAPKVSLSKGEAVQKIVLEKAPHLIDLTKKAIVTMDKHNLTDVTARVLLVLDESGSMSGQYSNGTVQRLLDKVLPVALLFDDDKTLEVWAFASRFKALEDVTLDNISGYINRANGGWINWDIGGTNNEPAVMQAIWDKHKSAPLPVYILFVSDGGVSKNRQIKSIITQAAHGPLFWQFVGIGRSNYGALEKLDEMSGRVVDNANFFALDDLDSISDEALYDRLMGEFPSWLRAAREKGILSA